MFCVNCGSKIEDGAVFCTSCGSRALSQEAEPTPKPKPEPKPKIPLSTNAELTVHEALEDIRGKSLRALIAAIATFVGSILFVIASFTSYDYTDYSGAQEVVGGFLGIYGAIFGLILVGVAVPLYIVSGKGLQKTNVPASSYRVSVIICIVLAAHVLGVGIFVSIMLGIGFIVSVTAPTMSTFIGGLALAAAIFASVLGGQTTKVSNELNRSFKELQ